MLRANASSKAVNVNESLEGLNTVDKSLGSPVDAYVFIKGLGLVAGFTQSCSIISLDMQSLTQTWKVS